MLKEIRSQLIELARMNSTWSYSMLNDQLQLGLNFDDGSHRKLVGDWLEEISLHELDKERPLISSMIVHKSGKKEQGDGYYKLCEKLYNRPWKELKGDRQFEKDRIDECHAFWKDNDNYKKYKNDFK